LIFPHLKKVTVPHETIIFKAEDTIGQVHFPHSGIISLMAGRNFAMAGAAFYALTSRRPARKARADSVSPLGLTAIATSRFRSADVDAKPIAPPDRVS
jgi:hypothetical protein